MPQQIKYKKQKDKKRKGNWEIDFCFSFFPCSVPKTLTPVARFFSGLPLLQPRFCICLRHLSRLHFCYRASDLETVDHGFEEGSESSLRRRSQSRVPPFLYLLRLPGSLYVFMFINGERFMGFLLFSTGRSSWEVQPKRLTWVSFISFNGFPVSLSFFFCFVMGSLQSY